MQSRYGLPPSSATYTCLIHACVRNKQIGQALNVLDQMRERLGTSPDTATYSMLINGCATSSPHLTRGLQLADEALQQRVDISAEVLQGLVTSGLRRRPPAAVVQQIQEFSKKHNVPTTEKSRERLEG